MSKSIVLLSMSALGLLDIGDIATLGIVCVLCEQVLLKADASAITSPRDDGLSLFQWPWVEAVVAGHVHVGGGVVAGVHRGTGLCVHHVNLRVEVYHVLVYLFKFDCVVHVGECVPGLTEACDPCL